MPTKGKLPDDLSIGLFKLAFQALGTQCRVMFRSDSVKTAEAYRDAAMTWVKVHQDDQIVATPK